MNYNRSVLRFAPILILALLCSCSKNIETKEAVQAAVMKRLTTVSGLNVDGMDVEIGNLTFKGKEAEAEIVFRAKGSADTMLKMTYKLERNGEEWVVKSTSGGMGGQLPPSHGGPAGANP
ncbi:MAG: hypothetical protein NW208_05160 [Bryobacter sp.]|nr:hypothetical protein [Bryobacter sp.]